MKKVVILFSLFILTSFLNITFIANGAAVTGLQVSFTENPIIVSPGSTGYIELNIDSIGTDNVDYIQIETTILDSNVIKRQGNWDVNLGSLDGGKSTSVVYEFYVSSSANPGLYQIIFETHSSASDSKITAIIKVKAPSVLDLVSFNPSSINIGKVETIIFNISNNGESASKNILFTWEDPNDLILPIGSDNRIVIPSIPAKSYSEISVDIMASPSIIPGVYPLIIKMEYYDDTGTQETITSTVGLQIGGGTDFEIILQQSTGGTSSFAIANTGVNVASSVIVSIPQQINYVATGTSSVSLGNLDAGDYTLASFQLSSVSIDRNTTERPSFGGTPGDMPSDFNFSDIGTFRNRSFGNFDGNNNLIIEISYTDLFGVRQIVEKEVAIESVSSTISTNSNLASRFGDISRYSDQSSEDSTDGTIYIVIGVVGIILIVAILKVGKSKKLSKLIKKGKKGKNK